jgi:hypothetical protein
VPGAIVLHGRHGAGILAHVPERLSVFDLAELAADVGPNARNIGVLLELGGPALDLDHHVRGRSAAAAELLEVTAAILSEQLDPARPWWTLTVVDVPDERRAALVWSSHHAMADGPSVLAGVLAVLQGGPARRPPTPEPLPDRRRLTRGAWAGRARALGGAAAWPGRLAGFRELGLSTGRAPASPLNRPVTAGFVLRTVDVDLAGVRAGARTCGATVNDAVLWAWGRALHRTISAVGSDGGSAGGGAGGPLVASCTVAAPSAAFQNRVGIMRVPLPAPGSSVAGDLTALASDTRRRKSRITGSSWWLTAQLFRAFAALRLYRRFVERQRSITTLVTNLRGPARSPVVLGRRVTRAVPVATLVGNVTTVVAALSCADRFVLTVMCAPEATAFVDALAGDLDEGLAAVARLNLP